MIKRFYFRIYPYIKLLFDWLWIVIALFFMLGTFINKPESVETDVSKVKETADTLQKFSGAYILSSGKISIPVVSAKMRYLAPRPFLDPIYALLLFFSVLIYSIFFRSISFENMFTRKTLLGLRMAFWLFLAFAIANFFRYDWFYDQVTLLTNGQYSYEMPFVLIASGFIMCFILLRLTLVFLKGINLQKDSDLTV